MNAPLASGRAASRTPKLEDCPRITVLSIDQKPLPKIAPPDAEVLLQRHMACWLGRGNGQYLQMLVDAPFRSGNSNITTRQITADKSCKHYRAGEHIGAPVSDQEFKPQREATPARVVQFQDKNQDKDGRRWLAPVLPHYFGESEADGISRQIRNKPQH